MNTELMWLKERYLQELNELYCAEMDNLEILPRLAAAAETRAAQTAFQYHLEKTRIQIWRLNQLFAHLGNWPAHYGPSHAQRPAPRWGTPESGPAAFGAGDAALTAAARRMEQRLIPSYRLSLNCAELLHDRAATDLLEQNLTEQYEADQIFSELSQPEPALAA